MKIRITRAQGDIMLDGARFRGLFCGRRWGKTDWAMMKALRRWCKVKTKIAYITPVAAQATPQYRRLLHHPVVSRLFADYGCCTQPYPILTNKITGGEIQFRSFERPGNVRSQGLNEVIVDEIQLLKDRDEFWGVIRALIADRRGELTVAGQFRGRNWVYEDFWLPGQPGAKTKIPLYRSYRFPTSTGIAFQSAAGRAELEQIKLDTPASVWDQEYLCLASENGARVFRAVERCTKGEPVYDPPRGRSYCIFWDTAKEEDPAAWLVLDVTQFRGGDRSFHVCDCGLMIDMETPAQLEIVAKLQRKYWGATVAIDITGAGTQDRLLDFVREKVKNPRGVYFRGGNKEALVRILCVEMERARLTIPPVFKQLIDQLVKYEYEYEGKNITYGNPPGEHDDLVSCLLGALAMALDNWGENPDAKKLSQMVG